MTSPRRLARSLDRPTQRIRCRGAARRTGCSAALLALLVATPPDASQAGPGATPAREGVSATATGAATPTLGETTASAEEILAAARAVSVPARGKSSRVKMTIVSPSGEERTRTLRGFEKRTAEGRKLLWLFDSPADLAGIAFLAWQHPPEPDEMWVYFPGQRRVRRIPPDLRREQFQGSTFTYEDLTTVFSLDYGGTHTLRGVEPCGEQRCWVIETALPPQQFVYDRLRTWIRADNHLPSRIELEGGGMQKVLQVRRFADVAGIPTILEVEMATPADGFRTAVEFSAVDYGADLVDDMFTVGYLSRQGK